MYVPEGMKDQQYAIRLGDNIRRRMGGRTVRAGRFVPTSPVIALRHPYRDALQTRQMRGEAPRPAHDGTMTIHVGGHRRTGVAP